MLAQSLLIISNSFLSSPPTPIQFSDIIGIKKQVSNLDLLWIVILLLNALKAKMVVEPYKVISIASMIAVKALSSQPMMRCLNV
jgi:hypothetical protein